MRLRPAFLSALLRLTTLCGLASGVECGTVSTKATPSCGKGSGTASRHVAYYEGWNTRRRPCDKVWPDQIDTTGLTQIVFSFATIHPDTFAVGPMHPDDEKLYADFLGLKDGSEKWIGIGGWEFSDAGPTHQTWSLMASSKNNRQAFISSLLDFLKKWDFAGVDIDWEWPGADTRGGNTAIDKQNQVDLMKELRATLGSRGLSVVLPAQYAYLQNLDPKALQGSIDAFNVLAYDLHGPWDSSIPGLGPYVKPHTDLNEIDAALGLLWSTGVTPSKVNLGIANYGRGFILADTGCAHINCTWSGPSKAGLCTQLDGILSQCEIQRVIHQHSLRPELVEGAAIKQIVFDGQWFGFDDYNTLSLKTELANNRCLGGTALWAIDYVSCTGGGPVGPGSPQQSSNTPSSSALASVTASTASLVGSSKPPGSSTASMASSEVSSKPADTSTTSSAIPSSAEPAPSSESMVSSAPAMSSKPAASSTTSSGSAKPPAPMPPSGPSSALESSEPATSTAAFEQSSQAASLAPSFTPSTTSVMSPASASSAQMSSTASSVASIASRSETSSVVLSRVTTSQEVPSGSSSQTLTTFNMSSAELTLGASSAQTSSASTTASDSSAASWSATSSVANSSEAMSPSSDRTPILISTIFTETSEASDSSVWTWPTSLESTNSGSSDHSKPGSPPLTSIPIGSSPTTVTQSIVGTGVITAVPIVTPNPPDWLPERCLSQCLLLDWCRPLCFGPPPPDPPQEGLELPWFMDWWWTLPVPGCVPNNCVDECHDFFGISLALFKQPFCTCVPTTCTKGEEKEKKNGHKQCKFLGCGCGFMGLPFICKINNIEINWSLLWPHGFFWNPNPCYWFGCPSPPGPQPGPPGWQQCGVLGCNGYCYDPLFKGCDPCPKALCPEGGPKTGPDPTPVPSRRPPKKCEEKDKTTVTERFVSCFENLSLDPTTIASINFTQTDTLKSACATFDATITGCAVLGTLSTTTITTFKPSQTPEDPGECEEKDKTTITKKIMSCFERLKLEPTTVALLNLTRTETITTSCSTREEISTVCKGVGYTTTTTATSFTRTSEVQVCSRVPLDPNNDMGDNPQPPRGPQAPSCAISPLLLNDEEGDNSQPTSDGPVCSRAPLSLDDEEGDNEMPDDMWSTISGNITMSMTFTTSREAPPSTLSEPITAPWGTGIPTGAPGNHCSGCDKYFAKCVKDQCKLDGSDAETCAKSCLSQLCYDSQSPDYCKAGSCKPTACPIESPHVIATAEPGTLFTTTLFLPSTTIAVTATPPNYEPTLSHSPTPTCTHGQEISPHGKWTVLLEHRIHQRPDNATFKWDLWDEHGCHAGNGVSSNTILGQNVSAEIGAMGRPQKDMMKYMLHTNVTESLTSSSSEIYFQISKPVAGCQRMCHVGWKVNNPHQSHSWEIIDDCAQACGMRELNLTDVTCEDGMNKWQDNGDSATNVRGGYCTFADDSAPPPPAPWTRNSQWTIDLIQQMEYKTASIEWWLRDPNGNNASHYWWALSKGDNSIMIETDPSTPQDKKMRYKMLMSVTDAMDKDKTRLQITYQNDRNTHCHYCEQHTPSLLHQCPMAHVANCQPSYQTETNDEKKQSLLDTCYDRWMGWWQRSGPCPTYMIAENSTFSCDPVSYKFKPLNAGFERRFKCWWPNDFDDPFGKTDPPPPVIHWQIYGDTGDIGDTGGVNGTAGATAVGSGGNGSRMNSTWR